MTRKPKEIQTIDKTTSTTDSKIESVVEVENTDSVHYTTKSTNIKKQLKLDDTILISVTSNVYGELIYIDHKTKDKTIWNEFGDVQYLTIGALRNMKAGTRSFYSNNWIRIAEISEDGYENLSINDIYTQLQVSQYYKESLSPSNLNQVFNWSIEDISQKVPLMLNSAKSSLIVAANQFIKSGVLDSHKKIKTLEDVLGCSLTSQE